MKLWIWSITMSSVWNIFGLDSASYGVSTLVVFALIAWRNRITIRNENVIEDENWGVSEGMWNKESWSIESIE